MKIRPSVCFILARPVARAAFRSRPAARIGQPGGRRGSTRPHGALLRSASNDARHPFPTTQSRLSYCSGSRTVGQRPANADPLPQSFGRSLRTGDQFRRQPRCFVIPARGTAAGDFVRLRGPAQRRDRRIGLDRGSVDPARHHGRIGTPQGHHGDPDPRHDVR